MFQSVTRSEGKPGGAFRVAFLAVLLVLCAGVPRLASAQFYQQSNLLSDVPNLGAFTDTNLVGAWGLTRTPTSPWWVNSTMGRLSLVFNGSGQPLPVKVAIPPTNQATPTGIAAYVGTGFEVQSNLPAHFIFVTLNGTISAWNAGQTNPGVAVLEVDNSGTAMYTGVTLAQQNGEDRLFAANFRQGTIDVFDTSFQPVTMPTWAFSDHRVPTNLTVFNVQAVGTNLYVTYAPKDVFATFGGPGQGAVDVFDTNGMLRRRLTHGFWMNAPWGVVLAPAGFGEFSNQVLVGMFGNGAIVGFDPRHGRFEGFLRAPDGLPLRIEQGLWGLGFGNGGNSGPTNTLYFASDFRFAGQFHGLVGTLTAVPGEEPEGDRDDRPRDNFDQ